MHVDLLIKNGMVIDPSQNIHAIQDGLGSDGLIVQTDENEEVTATRTVDAAGLLVTPGIIDLHAHVYRRHVPL